MISSDCCRKILSSSQVAMTCMKEKGRYIVGLKKP